MWRFWVNNNDNPILALNRECDRRAFYSCEAVFKELDEVGKRIINYVFSHSGRENMNDIVNEFIRNNTDIEPKHVWYILKKANYALAKRRGLI